MNAANAQTPDDHRLWTPSRLPPLPTAMPRQDPVAQLIAEEQRERTLLRLALCAAASILILIGGAGLLG
jgi:hypothetical protein